MEKNPTISQLKGLVYNEKHFTARWLKRLKEVTGMELHILTGGIIAILSILLIQGEQSQYLANALLIAVPILLFVAYPKECPSIECMVVYSASYALLTLLDSGIERDWQSYYLFKVFMLSLLFLEPFNAATRILEAIQQAKETYSTPGKGLSYDRMNEPAELSDSSDVITANVLDERTPSKIAQIPNPDDVLFNPHDKLIVNAPFLDNYTITITNNAENPLAVELKSTARNRVRVDPPSAIVKPKSITNFIIKIKPGINFNEVDVSKDRLAFDYVFCPKTAKKYSYKFFQGDIVRRRKNLPIQYNL